MVLGRALRRADLSLDPDGNGLTGHHRAHRVEFLPTRVRVAVAGVQVRAETSGREITWRATRQGGMTVNVATEKGWVIYVGRLKLR